MQLGHTPQLTKLRKPPESATHCDHAAAERKPPMSFHDPRPRFPFDPFAEGETQRNSSMEQLRASSMVEGKAIVTRLVCSER
jgi:hypothetical protein